MELLTLKMLYAKLVSFKDCNGGVLGAPQAPVKDFVDPSGIEALAAFRALNFAKEMGFMHDIVGRGL